jgi:hypothetical protein
VELEARAEEANVHRQTLLEPVGAEVEAGRGRRAEAREAVSAAERQVREDNERRRTAAEARARGEQRLADAQDTWTERQAARQNAVAQLQGFAATGLLAAALPQAEVPALVSP